MKRKNEVLVLISLAFSIGLISIITIFPHTFQPQHQQLLTIPPPNVKIAFIGDQGLSPNSVSVLKLIKNEGASMVVHSGDFDYTDDPDAWDQQINDVLGSDFPYLASIGNHDIKNWKDYRQKLSERLSKTPDVTCTGELGVKSSCTFQGLFFILSGVGTFELEHDKFIKDELSKNNSIWSICSWHKNMNKMQMGKIFDGTGWEVYEECRKGGAMIVTGHEHSYSRTKTLLSIENVIVDPDWPDPNNLKLGDGTSFVVVSGIGGVDIKDQDRCLPTTYPYGCKGEWASIYTSDQGASYGALFCTFPVDEKLDKAYCYFKDINGNIPDEFIVTSFV